MKIRTTLRSLAALAAALACGFATPASAEWRRAESPNFVVYSQGNEGSLRRYVRNLEIYDYLLRLRMGLPIDQPNPRRLPIYLVSGRAGLLQVHPRAGPNVAGTYFPVAEDIFAVAFQDSEQDYLLHEYFHHFSMQMGATATLPGWLTEGMAEYFMTADIEPGSVKIGGYNEDRVRTLFNASWVPLEDLLTKRYGEIRVGQRPTYYPLAWMLTHWFMSDDARREQLGVYIADVQRGIGSREAMERATGMTLEQLRAELRRYRRLSITTYTADFPLPDIQITTLPRSADDLLLIGQRLKVGVAEDRRDETAALVRRLAARHPDDPMAMLHLGHAELHFGDPDAGEAALTRLLDREPDNVEALQLMAARFIALAGERPESAEDSLRRAKSYLGRAYAVAPNEYYTLHLLSRTRVGAVDYPNENDLVTLYNAKTLAPQLASIRLDYASALMRNGEFDEAVAVLGPLSNAAHGGGAANAAKVLIGLARAGDGPPDAGELYGAVGEEAGEPSEGQPADQRPDEAEPETEPVTTPSEEAPPGSP